MSEPLSCFNCGKHIGYIAAAGCPLPWIDCDECYEREQKEKDHQDADDE